MEQDYPSQLKTKVTVDPSIGIRIDLRQDHDTFKATKPGTGSRKDALLQWQLDLDPYLDNEFFTGLAPLIQKVDDLKLRNERRASTVYEEGLKKLLRGVEYRHNFDGDKSLQYSDDD